MRHGLSLLTLLAALPGCVSGASTAPVPVFEPSSLPSAALTTLDGRATELGAYLHGRAAIVSFWATWCDACNTEMGPLNRLNSEMTTRSDALVVGVAVGEAPDAVRRFAEGHRLLYALLVDRDFAFVDALGERRVPATLVVDRVGRVVFRGGALDAATLAAFRSALAGE